MAEKSSQKRKREESRYDRPSKKAAVQGMNHARITENLKDDGLHPILLATPGLTAPAITFDAYSKQKSTDNFNETPGKHDLLLHSSQHPRLDYNASPAALDQHMSHYIAIFDPSTKQLQVSPVYHLSLRSTLRSQPKDDADKRRRTIGQQRVDLGREFGTKKAKKAIAAKTINAIVKGEPGKAKDEAQMAILNSMAEVAIPTLGVQEQVEAALADKPIPKPNPTATNVEDVYTFDTLIPPAHARLVAVADWQKKARADEEFLLPHRFPVIRVTPLGKTDDVLRLKALRYLALLLDFHSILMNAGRSGKKVPKKEALNEKLSAWPEALVNLVRLRFANTQNELPKWYMDNLYTHICALSLYVDVWTTDTTHLRLDLRMENKDIMRYFRELGCTIGPPTGVEKQSFRHWWAPSNQKPMSKEVAAVTRIAKLKLPLEFPKARSGGRK